MQLWSIQTLAAWQTLQTTGVLRTDPRRIAADFLPAYQWMVLQMQSRIGPPPPGCQFPIWVWQQCYNAAKPKPDLRQGGHLPKGMPGVLLALVVDERSCLLSDFDLWHYVLNYWYLPTSNAEQDDFVVELARVGLDYYQTKPLPDPLYHRRMEESWQRIFDLDWAADGIASPKAEKAVQATLWEIRLEQVQQVKAFIAR